MRDVQLPSFLLCFCHVKRLLAKQMRRQKSQPEIVAPSIKENMCSPLANPQSFHTGLKGLNSMQACPRKGPYSPNNNLLLNNVISRGPLYFVSEVTTQGRWISTELRSNQKLHFCQGCIHQSGPITTLPLQRN